MVLSLHTLPVEIVYRILDDLDVDTILISCRNVCQRLNDMIDTYHRYKVTFITLSKYSYTLSFNQRSFFREIKTVYSWNLMSKLCLIR